MSYANYAAKLSDHGLGTEKAALKGLLFDLANARVVLESIKINSGIASFTIEYQVGGTAEQISHFRRLRRNR